MNGSLPLKPPLPLKTLLLVLVLPHKLQLLFLLLECFVGLLIKPLASLVPPPTLKPSLPLLLIMLLPVKPQLEPL